MGTDEQAKVSDMRNLMALLIASLLLALIILGVRAQEKLTTLSKENEALKTQNSQFGIESPRKDAEITSFPVEGPRRSLTTPPDASEPPQTEPGDPFLAEARKLAQEDPEAAMFWLQEQSSGTERLRGMLEVVAIWAAEDSESALLWLESNAQGLARLETLNSGVELWAEKDPVAAADWIDGMANDGSKITAAKSLAATWAKSSPEEASRWVQSLPSGSIRDASVEALALAWIEKDPKSATTWANAQFAQSRDGEFLQKVVQKFTEQAPQAAENYIRETPMADPFLYQSYIEGFVETRANEDPAQAIAWLQSLPEGDQFASRSSTTQVVRAWTETDSIAASTWLGEQPIGPDRDAAIVGFAESIQRFEPDAAVAWANTISDPDLRLRQITQSFNTWANSEPETALNWVINSGLEPALQEQLARGVDFSPVEIKVIEVETQ